MFYNLIRDDFQFIMLIGGYLKSEDIFKNIKKEDKLHDRILLYMFEGDPRHVVKIGLDNFIETIYFHERRRELLL